MNEVMEVLGSTLSVKQSGSPGFIAGKIRDSVRLLSELGMLEYNGEELRATSLGRVTSFTYLDPLTVSLYKRLRPSEPRDLYLLHIVCMSPDFKRSSPYIQERVVSRWEDIALEMAGQGLIPGPSLVEDYDDWLDGFMHAMILYDWINEVPEDDIVSKYMIGPGDLYNMRDTASWITHALSRIEGSLGNIAYRKALTILTERLDKGVKEDALELTSLRLIGRVRARILIQHGIRSLRDLAETPASRIASLPKFGPRVVEEIERQLRELGLKE